MEKVTKFKSLENKKSTKPRCFQGTERIGLVFVLGEDIVSS